MCRTLPLTLLNFLNYELCAQHISEIKCDHKWAQTEVTYDHQDTFFYCKGDQALEDVARRGGGVSIPGDIQKPSGHGPK